MHTEAQRGGFADGEPQTLITINNWDLKLIRRLNKSAIPCCGAIPKVCTGRLCSPSWLLRVWVLTVTIACMSAFVSSNVVLTRLLPHIPTIQLCGQWGIQCSQLEC